MIILSVTFKHYLRIWKSFRGSNSMNNHALQMIDFPQQAGFENS